MHILDLKKAITKFIYFRDMRVVRRKFKDCTTDEEREEFKKKIEEEKKKLHDIPTISLETKVTIPNSGEELKLKFPESRQKRDYKNLNFTYLLALEKEIKWEEEKLCAKNCQVDPTRKLAYILKYRAIHKYYLNHVVSVLGGDEGYAAKYGLNPREFLRVQAIFCHISRVES